MSKSTTNEFIVFCIELEFFLENWHSGLDPIINSHMDLEIFGPDRTFCTGVYDYILQ